MLAHCAKYSKALVDALDLSLESEQQGRNRQFCLGEVWTLALSPAKPKAILRYKSGYTIGFLSVLKEDIFFYSKFISPINFLISSTLCKDISLSNFFFYPPIFSTCFLLIPSPQARKCTQILIIFKRK